MVSAQYYLKIFFNIIPQRFKLIKKLKSQKAKIDNIIISGRIPSSQQISQLMDIIGKDVFFRRAEKRNQPTLRHIVWKILRSLQRHQRFSNKIKINDIPVKFRTNIINLNGFLNKISTRMILQLQALDEIYKQQVEILEFNLKNESNSYNINKYKKLIEGEEKIVREAEPYYKAVRERTITIINVLRGYLEFLNSSPKGKDPMVELLIFIAFAITYIISMHIQMTAVIMSKNTVNDYEFKQMLAIGGILIGVTAKIFVAKGIQQYIDEVVKEEMI